MAFCHIAFSPSNSVHKWVAFGLKSRFTGSAPCSTRFAARRVSDICVCVTLRVRV